MARVMFDPGVGGYRGRAGNSVFRKRGTKTVLAKRPDHSDRELSAAQEAHLERFRKAVEHGKRVMSDPVQRAVYEEAALRSGDPLFGLMVRDYLRGPEVEAVDLSSYEGAPDDVITITATDDIKVVRVDVVVKESDGTLIEEGMASMGPGGKWVYTTTASVPPGTTVQIAATAVDGPGNKHTLEAETTLA